MIGFIKLNRQITRHWVWLSKPFSNGQAWVDLLMAAQYEPRKVPWDSGFLELEQGQLVTSTKRLSDRWGWSRSKVVRFLNLLESDEMAIKECDTKKTVITIVNYRDFQDRRNTEKTQTKHERNTDETPANTYKNIKNEKNIYTAATTRAYASKAIKHFQEKISPVCSTVVMHDMNDFLNAGVSEDLIICAIDEAVRCNGRNWKYIMNIILRCQGDGILTAEDWHKAEELKAASKAAKSGGRGDVQGNDSSNGEQRRDKLAGVTYIE